MGSSDRKIFTVLLYLCVHLSCLHCEALFFRLEIHADTSGMAALLVIIGQFLAAVTSAVFLIPLLYSHKLSTITQVSAIPGSNQ